MSNVIDERVVEMRFDNQQFKQAAGESLTVLEKLGKCIDKSTTGENVGKIAKSIDGINFGKAINGVDTLASKFSALGIVGKRVLENITDGIMGKLSGALHNVTNSIVSGGINRAMNIENARFQLQGIINDTKAMEAGFKNAGEMVEAVMKQAGDSVDGTAYSYDAAAKAASMFAASGVKAGDQMANSLKAIAGVSATFNANYEDISNVFTTIAGQGKVMAYQLNQLSFRGMNAAASLADYFNEVKKDPSIASAEVSKAIQDMSGNLEVSEADIRDFVSKGKISFDIFSEAMSHTFGDHAQAANDTFTGAMANIRAALARTGAMFISPLIEQKGAFVQLFNSIRLKINEFNKVLPPIAKKVTDTVNSIVLSVSKAIDGIHMGTIAHSFTMTANGIANVLKGLLSYIKPIGDALVEAFGGATYSNMINISRGFMNLTKGFKASEGATKNIKDAFTGVFDLVKLAIDLIGRFTSSMFPMIESGKSAGEVFLDLLGTLGRLASKYAEFIRNNEAVAKAFEMLRSGSAKVWEVLNKLVSGISTIFEKLDFSKLKGDLSGIESPLKSLGDFFGRMKGNASNTLKEMVDRFRGLKVEGKESSEVMKTFSTIMEKIRNAFSGFGNKNSGVSSLQNMTDGLSKSMEKLKSSFSFFQKKDNTNKGGMFSMFTDTDTGPIVESLARSIDKLSDAMAEAIKKGNVLRELMDLFNKVLVSGILIKLNNLTSTINGLADIGSAFNNKNAGASTDNNPLQNMLDTFLAPLKNISSILATVRQSIADVTKGLVKDLNAVANLVNAKALKEVAISIGILAGSLFVLSLIDPDQLVVGLGAISVMFTELVGAMILLDKVMGNSKSLKGAFSGLVDALKIDTMSKALMKFALAILVLSVSVKMLSELSWEELAKGLTGVSVLLLELVAFGKMMDAKNLSKIGVSLIATAVAIRILVGAVQQFGNMNLETLAKGLGAVGVALLEFAAFSRLSGNGGFGKGAGLILMATSMLIIAKVLQNLSTISWEKIQNGLIAMGAALLEMTMAIRFMPEKGAVGKAFAAIEMAAAMVLISKALVPLTAISQESLLNAVMAMGATIIVMVAAINNMPQKGGIRNAFAAIEMATAMFIIAKSLVPLTEVNAEGLLYAVLAMGATIGAMVATIKFMPDKGAIRNAFAMIEMALAFMMISKALAPLASVNTDGLLAATIAMGAIMLEMSLALGLMSKYGSSTKMFVAGSAMLEMASTFAMIAKALMPLTQSQPESLLASMVSMGVLIGVMVASLVVLEKEGVKAVTGGFAAIEIALAMSMVAKALMPLTTANPEALGAATLALCAAVAAMALALIGISAMGPVALAGGLAAVGMAAAMWIVAQSLMPLTTASPEALTNAVIAMGAALLEMAVALLAVSAMGPMALAGAASAIGMAAAMLIIAMSLKALAEIPFENLMNAVAGLAAALTVLAAATALMSLIAPEILIGAGVMLAAALALSASMMVMAPAIASMVNALSRIEEINGQKFAENMPAIAGGLALLGLSLQTFGLTGVIGASALVIVAAGLNQLVPAIEKFAAMDPQTLGQAFADISKGISEFGEALKSFGIFSGIGASALNTVADAVSKLAPAIKLLIALPANTITTVMSALATGFTEFGESLKSFGFFSGIGASAMNSLAESVSTLAPALMVLSMVPGEKLAQTMKSIGEGFKAFGEALEATPLTSSKGRAKALNVLCDGVKTLSEALPALGELDNEKIKTSLDSIGKAFQEFGTAIGNTPVLFANGRAGAIGTLCDQIKKLADGLSYFIEQDFDADTLDVMLSKIGTAFQNFGTAIDNTPVLFTNERAGALGTVCDQIMKLADGMKYFMSSGIDPAGFQQSLTMVGNAFTTFGSSLKDSPLLNADERAAGVSILTNNLKNLADGLNYFIQNSPGEGFADALDGIKSSFMTFGQALGNTPWFKVDERAGGIATLINNVKNLADGVNYFQQNTGEDSLDALDGIKTAISTFGEALKDSPFWNAEGRSNAMVNLIGSLNSLADAVTKIGSIEGDPATIMSSISTAVSDLGKAFNDYWSGLGEDTVTKFSGAVDAISKVAGIDAESLVAANDGIRNMVSWMNTLTSMDTANLTTFSESLTTLATEGIASFIAAFDASSGNIANSVTKFIQQVCAALKGKSTMFMQPGDVCGRAYLEAIKVTAVAQGPVTAIDIVNAVVQAIKNLESQFREVGISSAMAFINAFAEQESKARDAGTKIGNAVLQALKDIADEFKKTGIACVQGFADGLANNEAIQAVVARARQLGQTAVQTTQQATQVQSPSKKFRWIGEMCGLGLANGLKAMTSVVSEASADLGGGAVMALNDAVRSIYSLVDDYMDFDPTIRPDVDMSNIRRASDETTRLFNQAIGRTTLNAQVMSEGIISQRPTRTVEEIQNGIVKGANNYTFIQNNTSPKALSRLEIYRDTRSLLKQVEGV